MASNKALRDAAISHAIGIRRLGTGVVKEVVGLLDAVDDDLIGQIERIDPTKVYRKRDLAKRLASVRAVNKAVYGDVGDLLKGQLTDISLYEAGFF